MKKRLLAMLLALLLLCAFSACKKSPPPPTGEAPTIPTEPSQPQDPAPEISGEDGPTEGDLHLLQKGYPLGYSIVFVGTGGVSFDTVNAQITKGGTPKGYDFTSKLAALYNEMCEHNLYAICEATSDLTYEALSGVAPEGENERYTLTFTDNGVTHTVITDKAALERHSTRSDISNLNTLIISWTNLANFLYA